MLSTEGVPSFFKGISSAAFGAFSGNILYFWVYESVKETMKYNWKFSNGVSSYFGALFGQLMYNLLYLPCDLIRTRMQVPASGFGYQSLRDGVKKIIRHDGFKGLYPGWRVWLLSDIIATGFTFGIYEELKGRFLQRRKEINKQTMFMASSASYFVAASLVSMVTVPFGVIITRIQLNPKGKTLPKSLSILKDVFNREGLRGLIKGWTARVFAVSVSSLIAMPSYEILKLSLGLAKH